MKSAIVLSEKLRGSKPVLGVLIANHLWLELIESCIDAGLDFAIVDAEHFDHGSQLIADACAFGRAAGFPVLLRPPSIEPTVLHLAMDIGPCGLLLPMIEIPEQLDAVCESIYLPPRGQRRPGGPGNRWVTKYDYQSFRQEVEDTLVVIPQIESPQGLENASAIAAHPLTTALGVGPFDLSARMGICGDTNHPKMQLAHARILEAATAAGKPAWTIGDGPTMIARNFRFICIGEPTSLLHATLKKAVQSLHACTT
jgi:4-hydroxy-2-oxoheptanedioate aldolase